MASTSVTTKTVVVADDTAFVRDRFRSAVENAGHKAIVVKSAAELLARVRADLDHIDLLVLDLRLPHAPGVDLVRAIHPELGVESTASDAPALTLQCCHE